MSLFLLSDVQFFATPFIRNGNGLFEFFYIETGCTRE